MKTSRTLKTTCNKTFVCYAPSGRTFNSQCQIVQLIKISFHLVKSVFMTPRFMSQMSFHHSFDRICELTETFVICNSVYCVHYIEKE